MPLTELDEYTQDAVLRDGRTIHIRPIQPADAEALLAMFNRLSAETVRLRFFAPRRMDLQQTRYFTDLDYEMRFALVAEQGGRIVGVSSLDRYHSTPSVAEFAVLVEDAEQGRGLGTVLLSALMEPASDLGVTGFVGEVLRENRAMLGVLREAGFEPAFSGSDGVVEARFQATPTERFLEAVDERDRKSAVAALKAIFEPTTIAVIGASRDPSTIGGLVFANLLGGRFTGAVYPVNASAQFVQSVAAYPSLADCPSVPDLVIVAVPSKFVCDVVEEAGQLNVPAVVIVSSGFNEIGPVGAERERELMDIVHRHGLRVVGPNCMGVLNGAADQRMNATFSRTFPPPGRVGFSSQSGALGLAILGAAQRLGLGLSTFASVGNKADVSGNDLLQYWEGDPNTDVILLYLESFGNPRSFGRIARRVGRTKPIVAVKSGRTRAGERAASSHTGALAAGDIAVEALFRQAGVIRTTTLEDMFNVATLLANQPLPDGNRVAILTNGGGPGILAADACESNGLEVPELDPRTVEQLALLLPAEAGIRNPVDMIASASAETYGRAMRVLAADPNVDALMVIFIPPIVTRPEDVAREMVRARDELEEALPILSVFMSEHGVPAELSNHARIPSFAFPETAAGALGQVARYAAWRRRPLGNVVEVSDADVDAARAVVAEALPSRVDSAWLDSGQSDRLLRAFGITTAESRLVHTPEEAAAAQSAIGGPVAVKVAAPVHKTELHGVQLGLTRPAAVYQAIETMSKALREAGREDLLEQGFVVQEMIGEGVEMVVGVNTDPSFGPVLMAGMGGTLVELLRDVAVRIHPLTDVDVDDMLDSLRGAPLLYGYRGSRPVDVPALKALLFRLSSLVEQVPEIAECDMNPVYVRPRGVAVVDVRIRLARRLARRRR